MKVTIGEQEGLSRADWDHHHNKIKTNHQVTTIKLHCNNNHFASIIYKFKYFDWFTALYSVVCTLYEELESPTCCLSRELDWTDIGVGCCSERPDLYTL